MNQTMSLFGDVVVGKPEPKPVTVRLGKRAIQYPLHRLRRAAIKRLVEILGELEGKDIHISSCDTGGKHYWLNTLRLPRLKLEFHPHMVTGPNDFLPGVIVLWGSRDACVRIFTDYLVAVREQEYQGYWLYLLDFRNGFYESPIDNWKSHYACLHITKFKD